MKTARITLLVEYDKEAPTGAFFNSAGLSNSAAHAMDIVPIPRHARLNIIYDARIVGTPKVELIAEGAGE